MKMNNQNGSATGGILTVVAVVGVYLAAQMWILPSMGVAT